MDQKRISIGDWAKIAGVIVAIIVGVLGSGFFYNQWQIPNLTYKILDTYEVSDQVISGLVIENTGRSPSVDIEISLEDIQTKILDLNIPKNHGMVNIVSGGPGFDYVLMDIDLLAPGEGVTFYFVTDSPPLITEESRTMRIIDSTGLALRSTDPPPYILWFTTGSIIIFWIILIPTAILFGRLFFSFAKFFFDRSMVGGGG